MMVSIFSLCFTVLPLLVRGTPVSEENSRIGREAKHLLSFAPGEERWVTESELLKLYKEGKADNFIDLTNGDFKELENYSAQNSFMAPIYPASASQAPLVTSMFSNIDKTSMKTFLDKFSSYQNRYYKSTFGVQAAQFLFDELSKIRTTYARSNIQVEVSKFNHTSWSQFSIIVKLSGNASTTQDSVIVGAHLDSINQQSPTSGRAPGYDDNGTGVANNLECLKILLRNPSFVPKRPIEFHFYSAEEGGLRGSAAIANAYAKVAKPIYGVLNTDMSGYRTTNTITTVIDYTDKSLTQALRVFIQKYTTFQVIDETCGYACSDHASWNRAGYPASYHFEGTKTNPKLHTSSDTVTYVNFTHMAEFVKITAGFAVELSLF
jgi:leucyl aminopeptidase